MALRIIASLLLLGCCGAVALDDDSVLLQVAFDSADPHNWQEDPKTLKIVDQATKMAAGHMGKLDMDAIVAAIPKGVEVAQQLAQGLGLNIDMSKIGQLSAMAAPMAPMAAQMVEGPDGKLDMSKVAGLMMPVAEMAQAMGPEKIAEMVLGQAGYELDDKSRKVLASLKDVDVASSLKNIDVMKYMGYANQAAQKLPKAIPMMTKAVEVAKDQSEKHRTRMLIAMDQHRAVNHVAHLADQTLDAALISGNHVFSAIFGAAQMFMPQIKAAAGITHQDRSVLREMSKAHEELMNGITTLRGHVQEISHLKGEERDQVQQKAKAYAKQYAKLAQKESRKVFAQFNELLKQVSLVVPEEAMKKLQLDEPVREAFNAFSAKPIQKGDSFDEFFHAELKLTSNFLAGTIDNYLASFIDSLEYDQEQ